MDNTLNLDGAAQYIDHTPEYVQQHFAEVSPGRYLTSDLDKHVAENSLRSLSTVGLTQEENSDKPKQINKKLWRSLSVRCSGRSALLL